VIEGALILLSGMIIGGLIVHLYPKKQPTEQPLEQPTEQPYDKYKNKDGLYSRKAVKESR